MSVMSEATFRKLWPRRSLLTSEVRLCTYSKKPIPVRGCCYVSIAYKGQTAVDLPLIIVQGVGPTLLGRNWLRYITLDWKEMH